MGFTNFGRFTRDMARRLKQGREEYGDKSFSASPLALVQEVREELLDVASWAYILSERLDKIEQALSASRFKEILDEEDTGEHGGTSEYTLLEATDPQQLR